MILAVNNSWRCLATATPLQGPQFAVGQNYLDVCAHTRENCAEEAQTVVLGIRRVLQGTARDFTLEYPCDSVTERRWFQLSATPVREDRRAGAMVMHINISERKRIEQKLQRQQTELRALFDLTPAMIWFKDTHNGILRVNKRVADAAGLSVEEIEGQPTSAIYPQQADRFYADDLEVIRSGTAKLGTSRPSIMRTGRSVGCRRTRSRTAIATAR